MKALVLAAGYATRLHPLTENKPKHLLEVGGKAILGHIIDKINQVKEVSEIYIVTNHRFYDTFRIWLNHYPSPKKVKLIDDGTINNEDRLGAVGDINFVLKEESITEDLLVIAGDNLFGFSLAKFVTFFKEKNTPIVAFRDLKDVEKVRGKFGVGILEGNKLTQFEEKPLKPQSTLAATACYIFPHRDLSLVERSIEQKKADNTGDLIKYLVKESDVHGFVFTEHWFDIGSPESFQEAQEVYRE